MAPALPKKVLICDDDETLLDLLAAVLEADGFIALATRTAEQARTRFRVEAPDLMILDVSLPGRSGFEFIEELRMAGALDDTPFLFLTGREKLEDGERAFALGAKAFVVKPFNCNDLMAKVRQALETRHAQV